MRKNQFGRRTDETALPELPFPREEYDLRLRRTLDLMQDQGLTACLIGAPENIYYLTGFHHQGTCEYQVLILALDHEPALIMRFIDEQTVRATSWIRDISGYGDGDDPVDLTRNVMKRLGLDRATIGMERACWFLPQSIQERLENALPEVHWQDSSGLVERLRVIKSEREIDYVRQAARVAEAGMAAGLDAVQAGRTENDVAVEVYRGLISAGGEYPGNAPYVRSGPRIAMAHATWSGRPLEPGDVLFIELGGCVKRYHACLERCAVVGTPSSRVRSMADACLAALEATIAAMRPGVTAGEVDRAAHQVYDTMGWGQYFRHRAAYSLGIGFPPSWVEVMFSVATAGTRVLEPGMVFHVVPGLLVPGEGGVIVDETVLITPEGNEVLTHFPRDLRIVA